MGLDGVYRLAPDVRITPVRTLPPEVRAQLPKADGAVVTRPSGRAASVLLDANAAALVRLFGVPCTIEDAVRCYARDRKWGETATLGVAAPILAHLIATEILLSGSGRRARVYRTLRPGERIGPFVVDALIQRTGGSAVYRARTSDGVLAALKVVDPDRPEAGRCVQHEAEILRTLAGASAPRVLAYGQHRRRVVLGTAWREGSDVMTAARHAALGRSGDPLPGLVRLVVNVLDAYADLHSHGVIHGDVHPHNVIADYAGHVTVVDFGQARRIGDLTPDAQSVRGGVPCFFEPEFATAVLDRDAPPPTPAGEQYALAVLAFLLLTGNEYLDFPLGRDEAMRHIAEAPPRHFAQCSVDAWPLLEAVLQRALAKSPDDRFPSVAAFAAAFRDAGRRLARPALPIRTPARAGRSSLSALEGVMRGYWTGVGATLDGPTPQMPAGVERGSAGVAFTLYRLALVRDDPGMLSLASVWASRAGAAASRQARSIRDRQPGAAQSSFLSSRLSVWCVDALVAQARMDVAAQRRAAQGYLRSSERAVRDGSPDQAGMLHGLVVVYDTMIAPALRAALEARGNEIAEALLGAVELAASAQERDSQVGRRLGPDLTSSLAALLRWARVSRGPAFAGTINLVERWATYAALAARAPRPEARRAGGPASEVHLWTQAHALLADDRYAALATAAGERLFRERERSAALWRGTAGRAYALLRCYRTTGDVRWRHRAERLVNEALAAVDPSSHTALHLFHGALGVFLVGTEVNAAPARARMPIFDEEGWREAGTIGKALGGW